MGSPRGAGGVPEDPVRTEGSTRLTSRLFKVSGKQPLARWLPGPRPAPLRIPSSAGQDLRAGPLRNLRGPGSANSPTRRKGSGLCRKGGGRRSTDTSPPKARICRATCLPMPDGPPPKRPSVPEPRLAHHPICKKFPKEPLLDRADLRPEGRCTLLPSARRPAWQGRRKPKLPRRPLHLVWTRNPKAPDPPSCFSVEPKLLGEGRTAVIRRFHVQEDARAN